MLRKIVLLCKMGFDNFLIRHERKAFFVLVMFAIFGAIVFGSIIHEFSHKFDYRQYVQEEYMCIVNLPKLSWDGAAAYYKFSHNLSDMNEVKEIEKTTELKAYILSTLIFITIALCILSVLAKRKMDGWENV